MFKIKRDKTPHNPFTPANSVESIRHILRNSKEGAIAALEQLISRNEDIIRSNREIIWGATEATKASEKEINDASKLLTFLRVNP